MQDFLGNELNIGDEVVLGTCTVYEYSDVTLVKCIVKELLDWYVVVEHSHGTESVFPEALVKVIKEKHE